MTTVSVTSLLDEIYIHTTRKDLVNETKLALRQAVRACHRKGRFWKDLVEVSIAAAAETGGIATASLDLSAIAFPYRQVAYVQFGTSRLSPVDVSDVLDVDKVVRQNIYWGMGSKLLLCTDYGNTTTYKVGLLANPAWDGVNITSWLFPEYQDLVVAEAAWQLFGMIGEQEISRTILQLRQILSANLVQDNLEIEAR